MRASAKTIAMLIKRDFYTLELVFVYVCVNVWLVLKNVIIGFLLFIFFIFSFYYNNNNKIYISWILKKGDTAHFLVAVTTSVGERLGCCCSQWIP